jgi:hypothetical protein
MLEQLSYVADIAGVIAVIASVLYLARQIKEGNDLNRANTFREIMQGLGHYCSDMFRPENRQLIETGFLSYDQLSAYDKARFENLLAHYLNYVEDSFISSNVALLGDETMQNWVYWMQTRFFAYPGVREWWGTAKGVYAPDFQEWIDKVIETADTEEDVYGFSK